MGDYIQCGDPLASPGCGLQLPETPPKECCANLDHHRRHAAAIRAQRDEARAELEGSAVWEDKPAPEDAEIKAAHPLRTGDHETHAVARRLVSARHSKYALIDLVNWLLVNRDVATARAEKLRAALCPELRCPECGRVWDNIITTHRHAGGGCDETASGPDLRVVFQHLAVADGASARDAALEEAAEACTRLAAALPRGAANVCARRIRELKRAALEADRTGGET